MTRALSSPLDWIDRLASSAGGERDRAARGEVALWTALAVGSLAIAGVFAFLLALSRLPGIDRYVRWPLDFFAKGLVIHVVFSLVVWFLAAFALLAALATFETARDGVRLRRLGSIGACLVAVSFPLLFLPAFDEDAVASLNNYVPVIIHPGYYIGLAVLALGVLLPAVRLLVDLRGRARPLSLIASAMRAGAIVYMSALAAVLACLALSWGGNVTRAFNEHLFWGGGHLLQFLNTILMLTAWTLLLRRSTGEDVVDPDIFRLAVLLLALFSVPAPLFYAVLPPFSAVQGEAFRRLQFVVALPTMMVALSALVGLARYRRSRQLPWRDPAFLALALSVVVFGAGGVMGLLISGSDTRTPAHYHSMIAGVSLALMGVMASILAAPALPARDPGRSRRWQIALFGAGQLVASIGLFWAGGYGAPRKTPAGSAVLVDGAVLGMYLHGIGAALAVAGGAMFVVIMLRALARQAIRDALAGPGGAEAAGTRDAPRCA